MGKTPNKPPIAENLEIETKQLFAAADRMRGAVEPSDYKHIALGLLFLKHISEGFEAKHAALMAEQHADPEDRDEYTGDNIFWVPEKARWQHLQKLSKGSNIGKCIDNAMTIIEKDNPSLKGVLPKIYAKPELEARMLGDLIDLFSNTDFGNDRRQARDRLGRVYEYFLGQFAGAEGRRGGDFYTPRTVVRLLVDMLQPFKGRVYDPCCGSGGMFILSEDFVEEHGGKSGDISIWGQEKNHTTWRLSKMNLAIRGIDSDIRWNSEGTFHNNEFSNERFDYILANPPFNISQWGADRVKEDPRWKYKPPPDGNANYAWLQHILWQLSPKGTAGVVLANGSMSSEQSGEGEIRRKMIEDDKVDCMIALPGQLFYSTQIPVCLWFLAKNKKNGKLADRRKQILFIDARQKGYMEDRTHRTFSREDIASITGTYHKWREGKGYEDIPGFCKAADIKEIEKNNFVLTPGRYVGAPKEEDDGIPFTEKFTTLKAKLEEQMQAAKVLDKAIAKNLGKLVED